jgi:hypothetical protein
MMKAVIIFVTLAIGTACDPGDEAIAPSAGTNTAASPAAGQGITGATPGTTTLAGRLDRSESAGRRRPSCITTVPAKRPARRNTPRSQRHQPRRSLRERRSARDRRSRRDVAGMLTRVRTSLGGAPT